MTTTNIQWTDVTDNPIVASDGGWWCKKISEGCANCYAEKLNQNSFYKGNHTAYSGQPPEMKLKRELLASWARMRTPKKHFVSSMTDVFGDWVPLKWQLEILDAMAAAPKQTFQLLTKRPDIMKMAASSWLRQNNQQMLPPNIWLGTSVENQHWAEVRIPQLLAIPAQTKFLSVEPLLSSVNLRKIDIGHGYLDCLLGQYNCDKPGAGGGAAGERVIDDLGRDIHINWVICGGESGSKARPCRVEWLALVSKHCLDTNVPVFVKQLGAKPYCGCEEYLPGINDVKLQDKKGGDIEEFPAQLKIRQFPKLGE